MSASASFEECIDKAPAMVEPVAEGYTCKISECNDSSRNAIEEIAMRAFAANSGLPGLNVTGTPQETHLGNLSLFFDWTEKWSLSSLSN